jgi:molybdopterin converting factor small subunit
LVERRLELVGIDLVGEMLVRRRQRQCQHIAGERFELGLRGKLRGPRGEIRRFVNIYVNDSDVRLLEGSTTPVADGDEVIIIPAVAGG